MKFLYKPINDIRYMVVKSMDANEWNYLISHPYIQDKKDEAPLAIWGKMVDNPELDLESGAPRCTGANVEEIYALPVDVDNGCTMAEFERDYHRYSYQLYTTYSWHNGKEGDRFRVFFPLKEPIKVKWLVKPVKEKLVDMFNMADTSCFDQGHFQVLPTIQSDDKPYRYVQHQGERLSFAYDNFEKIATEYISDMQTKFKSYKRDDEDHGWLLRCVQKVFDETYEGERDKTVFREVCSMIRKGCSYGEIMSLRPPMGFEEAYIKKVNYIFSKGIR